MDTCIICQGPRSHMLTIRDYPLFLGVLEPGAPEADLRFDLILRRCKHCGHIAKDDTLPRHLKNIWYAQDLYAAPSPSLTGLGQAPIRQFLDFLAPHLESAASVLEIGCFDGFLMSLLAAKGFQVHGCDPNPACRTAREVHGLAVEQSLFHPGLYPGRRFGAIVARHVLEHLEDPAAMIGSMLEVLAPGGLLAVEVPDALSILRQGEIGAFHHEHVSTFTAGSLNRLMAGHGLVQTALERSDVLRAVFRPATDQPAATAPSGELCRAPLALQEEAMLARQYAQALERRRTALTGLCQQDSRLAVFGASGHTTGLISLMGMNHARHVKAVFDNDPGKHGKQVMGHTVLPPSRLGESGFDHVVVSSKVYQHEIARQLEAQASRTWGIVTLYPDIRIF